MKVKIKYEELVERNTTYEIDSEEFLEWANEGYIKDRSYSTVVEAVEDDPNLLKEFLEAGATYDWADGDGYDERLLEVTL